MISGQKKLDLFEGFHIKNGKTKLRKGNRLFLPLDEKWYRLFCEGKKQWELRGVNGIFNIHTVREGRTVELRRGYQSDALWGIITERLIVESMKDIPTVIFDKTIPPDIRNDADVMTFLDSYQKKYDRFILFKIDLIGDEDNG